MQRSSFVAPVLSRLVSKRMRRAVYCGPPGQDPAELFDTYPAPKDGHKGFVGQAMEPIGTKQRSLVHKDGDWHRSVHVWLTHPPSKSVLMQKRSPFKDTNPNKWDVSSAGHITHGDGSLDTAKKEVEEELGLSAEALPLEYLFTAVAQFSSPGVNCNEFQDVYLAELAGRRDSYKFDHLGESEVSAVDFVDMTHLMSVLDSEDENYVVRPRAYRERFIELLKERYSL